jgi:hypothetical protein
MIHMCILVPLWLPSKKECIAVVKGAWEHPGWRGFEPRRAPNQNLELNNIFLAYGALHSEWHLICLDIKIMWRNIISMPKKIGCFVTTKEQNVELRPILSPLE